MRGLGLLCSLAFLAAAVWLSYWERSSACKASCSSWQVWDKPSEQRAGFGDLIPCMRTWSGEEGTCQEKQSWAGSSLPFRLQH